MTTARPIVLGLSMRQLGYHAGGWRHPAVPAGGAMDIGYFTRLAQTVTLNGVGQNHSWHAGGFLRPLESVVDLYRIMAAAPHCSNAQRR